MGREVITRYRHTFPECDERLHGAADPVLPRRPVFKCYDFLRRITAEASPHLESTSSATFGATQTSDEQSFLDFFTESGHDKTRLVRSPVGHSE